MKEISSIDMVLNNKKTHNLYNWRIKSLNKNWSNFSLIKKVDNLYYSWCYGK